MVFHRTGKTGGTCPWTEATFRLFNTVPQLIISISSHYPLSYVFNALIDISIQNIHWK